MDIFFYEYKKDEAVFNVINNYGKTALIHANFNRCYEAIEILLKVEEINISIKDEEEKTALYWAILNKYTEIINLLDKKIIIYYSLVSHSL